MAKRTFLDFEQPIAELETKIEELRYVQTESAVDISEEIDQLSKKSQQLTKDIYGDLSPWQITKIARHAERLEPHLGRLAGHFAQAALDGDPARAVEFAQLAGWEAIARSGYHSAVERFLGPRVVPSEHPRRRHAAYRCGEPPQAGGLRLERAGRGIRSLFAEGAHVPILAPGHTGLL